MTLSRRHPCAAPPPPDEPDMFGPVKQPRTVCAEPDSVYADVLALRRAGRTVTRAGRYDHMVDGQRVSRAILAVMAKAVRPTDPHPRPSVTLYDILVAYSDVRTRGLQSAAEAVRPAPVHHKPQPRRPGLALIARRVAGAFGRLFVSQRAEGAGQG